MKKTAIGKMGLLFFLCAGILAALGCAKTAQPIPEPAPEPAPAPVTLTLADYFPLTLGSTWQYLGQGNEYATFSREVVFAASGKGQLKEENGGTTSAQVFVVDASSITRVFFQGEAYTPADFLAAAANDSTVILKMPIQVGTQWPDASGTREIVDIAASVSTPAGVFAGCLKVKITAPGSTSYEYFKDGVGMVKREFTAGTDTITSTLQSYTIAP